MSEFGFDIDFNELVYYGQCGYVFDYLICDGWQILVFMVMQLYEVNGFVYFDDEFVMVFVDFIYSSVMFMC